MCYFNFSIIRFLASISKFCVPQCEYLCNIDNYNKIIVNVYVLPLFQYHQIQCRNIFHCSCMPLNITSLVIFCWYVCKLLLPLSGEVGYFVKYYHQQLVSLWQFETLPHGLQLVPLTEKISVNNIILHNILHVLISMCTTYCYLEIGYFDKYSHQCCPLYWWLAIQSYDTSFIILVIRFLQNKPFVLLVVSCNSSTTNDFSGLLLLIIPYFKLREQVNHPRASFNTKNTSQPWGTAYSCQSNAKHFSPRLGQK